MDLITRLCDALNTITDLPLKVQEGYVQPNESINLYALHSSTLLNEDWSGNQTKRLKFEIAIRTLDFDVANRSLWLISDFLDSMDDIKSENDSFQFVQMKQTGLPGVSKRDTRHNASGDTVYVFDFYVDVITTNKK